MQNNSCIIYTDFLPAEVNSQLYNHTISISDKFFKTKIGQGVINRDWRKSNAILLKDFSKFNLVIKEKIKTTFVEICQKLQIDIFDIERIETHLTSHNDGEFYKPHVDNNTEKTVNRVITFVYYFHSIPKLFTGGQLLFLKNQPRPFIVEPANNSIVFFNSSLLHAVHPISCPDRKFEHGRFSLNGWIQTKKPDMLIIDYNTFCNSSFLNYLYLNYVKYRNPYYLRNYSSKGQQEFTYH